MTTVIKVITQGPQGPQGPTGGTLAGLTDITGTPGAGKAPVGDGAGNYLLTDIATQAELDAETAARAAAISALASIYQPLDSDLTAIAALSTTSFGRSLLALADAVALRTAAGLGSAATQNTTAFDAAGAAAAAQAASQPLDSDLTAIAALATTPFGRALLALADAAALRSTAGLVIGTDVEAHDPDLTAIAALDASIAGAIASDGAGWIKKTYAQFKTALSLVKADVGLGNVTNVDTSTTANITDSTDKRFVTDAQRTVIGNTSGTNTGDQTSVSGNAGTATALQTARNIDGQAFDGTAAITVIAPGTHAATDKATPADADELPLVDSAASNVLKKLTWANLKAALKAYTDTLYPSGSGTSTGTNTGDQTSVSGNAGTATSLQTARTIDGQSFDGTAAITVIAPGTHAATSKATPVDADELPLVDSAASNVLKRLTWANLKATLKTYFDTLYAPVGGGGLSIYGDGSDGTITFDGTTTVLGLTPSSSTYTLTRDIFLSAGTINNGVSIITAGFRIFCQGTLTNNGTIKWNGANGVNTNGGSSTSGTSMLGGGSSRTFGTGGVTGGTAAGTAGANQTLNYSFGGQGGTGGSGSSGAGGTGGIPTTPASGYAAAIRSIQAVILTPLTSAIFILGGTSGGSGGGDGTAGGGSGSGGGTVMVIAKTFAGTGAIQARGGDGGTPSSGNRGGGGGGGGGIVIVVSLSVSGGAISGQTIDANGGAGGGHTGTGTNGSSGSSGTVVLIPN